MENEKISFYEETSGVISANDLVTTLLLHQKNNESYKEDIHAQIDVHDIGKRKGNRSILLAEVNRENQFTLKLGINGNPAVTIQIQNPEKITLISEDNSATYTRTENGTYKFEFSE